MSRLPRREGFIYPDKAIICRCGNIMRRVPWEYYHRELDALILNYECSLCGAEAVVYTTRRPRAVVRGYILYEKDGKTVREDLVPSAEVQIRYAPLSRQASAARWMRLRKTKKR